MLAKQYVFMKKKISKKVITAIAMLSISTLPIFSVNSDIFTSLKAIAPTAEAVQLRDGKTHFLHLPILIGAETTVNRIYASSAIYYFAIALPPDMDEPLQKLEILQKEGFEEVRFRDNQVVSYIEKPTGERIEVASTIAVIPSPERSTLAVTFDPPIPAVNDPDSKLVIGVRPVRNPRYEGVYLFGVTAFPQGTQPSSQFLGYGRLSFYDWYY